MLDFAYTINNCQLIDPGFYGTKFTWAHAKLQERLDRILIGEGWTLAFTSTRVTHLPRVLANHCPLLFRCWISAPDNRSAFHFQNMWVRHHTFVSEVQDSWELDTGATGMQNLQFKLSRLKGDPKRWNKEVFGNFFVKLRQAEAVVLEAQHIFEENPSSEHRSNLNKYTAEYVLRIRMEEDFWLQKATIRWVADGERNTKYFQGWVKQKRIKSRIHEIVGENGRINEEEAIKDSAFSLVQKLLTSDISQLDESDLIMLHTLPAVEAANSLCNMPKLEVVKRAVFSIAGDSASSPDGFSALFYQTCWDIVAEDVVMAVISFFDGAYMPRSFTSTMFVLLPKKDNPTTWAEYQPISLCTVTNKIITKILAACLIPFLTGIMVPNQSGFIKGRILSNKVLLARELFHDLDKANALLHQMLQSSFIRQRRTTEFNGYSLLAF